jgi:4a-hydroxytetrahydrobiopterin dehydratase
MSTLADRECVPCRGGTPALGKDRMRELQTELGRGWQVIQDHHLEKEFEFEDFRGALDFTNQVGNLAEQVGHHPDIYLAWGKVKVTLWTHKVDGLTESDFILAAKIQQLAEGKPVKATTPLE